MIGEGDEAHRITSVEELCSLWDTAFIEGAYWAVLGRAPDPTGGPHYLNELRNGTAKLKILNNLRNSPEGQARRSAIAGLDEALAKHRKMSRPVTGAILGFFNNYDGNSRAERERRAITNLRHAIYSHDHSQREEQQLWRQVSSRLTGLAELADRQAQVESTLATFENGIEQLNRRLIRVEAAVKRVEESGRRSAASRKLAAAPEKPRGRASSRPAG